MGRSVDEVIASLPKARRDRIESKAVRLAREMIDHADSPGENRTAMPESLPPKPIATMGDFIPPRQLDLFEDSRNVILRNEVIAALSQRDGAACEGAIEVLAAEYADDLRLPAFRLLCQTLRSTLPVPLGREAAGAIMQDYDDGAIAVAAREVFGQDAEDWLSPLWEKLAKAIADYPFDPANETLHAAPALLRGGHWEAALACVEGIDSWRRQPAPLAWMIEAKCRIDGVYAIWPLLAELAWMAPPGAQALVPRLAQPELNRLVSCFDKEFEGEGTAEDFAWFPAWALVAAGGLAEPLRQAEAGADSPPERCTRIVLNLLTLERQGRHAELIEGRKKLRAAHPGLFARYMQIR